jgi:hypothetical protein
MATPSLVHLKGQHAHVPRYPGSRHLLRLKARLESWVTTIRRKETFQIRNRETADGPSIFKGAKRSLRGTGLGQKIIELGHLVGFALSNLLLWHSSRNKSRFEFLDTKAIHIPPITKTNGDSGKVGHTERI